MNNPIDYKELSAAEKMLLVEEIWDSIGEDEIVLNEKHQKLLDQRLHTLKNNPKRTPWSKIKEQVRANKSQ
ncbi:MAG: addiction module protein [Chitinophagales bacterium]